MSHLIRCETFFDITATGTRGGFRNIQTGQRDNNGCLITDLELWHRSRNQQRNWETLNQIISLRCLPFDISHPGRDENTWSFEFRVEALSAISNDRPLGALIDDCQHVPMIVNLDEQAVHVPYLISQGSEANIWFEEIGK